MNLTWHISNFSQSRGDLKEERHQHGASRSCLDHEQRRQAYFFLEWFFLSDRSFRRLSTDSWYYFSREPYGSHRYACVHPDFHFDILNRTISRCCQCRAHRRRGRVFGRTVQSTSCHGACLEGWLMCYYWKALDLVVLISTNHLAGPYVLNISHDWTKFSKFKTQESTYASTKEERMHVYNEDGGIGITSYSV